MNSPVTGLEVFLRDSEMDWLVFTLASAVVPKSPNGNFVAGPEDVLQAARFVLFEKLEFGFMDDMEATMDMIFTTFGWEWQAGDVAKLSRNVNDRKKVEAPAAAAAGKEQSQADAAKKEKKKTKESAIARFLPRIAELNARDIVLYGEARERYDAKKRGRQENAV